MDERIKIAIDGPSGAGKSTIAKALAERLHIDYIDTGAMYRAVGYKMKAQGVDPEDRVAVKKLLDSTEIDFAKGHIFLDGKIVDDEIRTPEISRQASICSALAVVREKLVELQQNMASKKSVVMDGRDIGTVVFPDAPYKFYLVASAEVRAERRYRELQAKGSSGTYEQVLEDIRARDHRDMTREVTPLRKAEDALEVDTTEMTAEEVTDFLFSKIRG